MLEDKAKMRIFYEEWQCLSIGSPLANQLQQLENKIEEGVEIGENMPNNFPKAIPDFKQSMKTISMFKDEYLGVATYKTKQDMPEELQKALPERFTLFRGAQKKVQYG